MGKFQTTISIGELKRRNDESKAKAAKEKTETPKEKRS